MASKDIKDFLFYKTGVAASQWKRLSKAKTPQGEFRIFENKAGTQVQTLESPTGVLSILETGKEVFIKQTNDTGANIKKAKALVLKYLDEGTQPDEKKAGYASIPSLFKFSFMQDANPDHSVHLEMAADAGEPSVAVTGFNIFMAPKDGLFEDYSFDHLEPLLSSFLPDFLQETEESSFCIHGQTQCIYDEARLAALKDGSIPSVPYDQFVATMKAAGFEYDASTCMLASLGHKTH